MLSGNLKRLNRESDTKAFSASRTFFSSTLTKTAKVVKATWEPESTDWFNNKSTIPGFEFFYFLDWKCKNEN